MFFEKSTPHETGVTGIFWKIDQVAVSVNGICEAWLSLYLDRESCESGKSPLQQEYFTLRMGSPDYNKAVNQLFEIVREALLSRPEFASAKPI